MNKNINFDYVNFLKTVPPLSGVYRMYNEEETIIYVGKAKNLFNRLHSYFVNEEGLSTKTQALVKNIYKIEFTVTFSESDALILEQNLIKSNKPKYNILLRDDKSYPYILLTNDEFPRIAYHRGAKKYKGTYFGPYPNSSAVKDSLKILQTIFPIRQCLDSVYKNRTRPCLMYQIKKCLGPCVKNLVNKDDYQYNVNMIKMFLNGKFTELLKLLTQKMESASENCDFEQAIKYRDQLFSLRKVQEQQMIDNENNPDSDILAIFYENGVSCVNVIFHRNGHIIGSNNFYMKIRFDEKLSDILHSFIEQYYSQKPPFGYPKEIILDKSNIDDRIYEIASMIETINSVSLNFITPQKGSKLKLLELANHNAKTAVQTKIKSNVLQLSRIENLEQLFSLEKGYVTRMECYDISHTFGERTVASMVVFDRNGPLNSAYRIFNITNVTAGDDFAAMKQVLNRRFLHAENENNFPNILFIDGGDGQLSQAEKVILECQIKYPNYKPLIIGISKGEGRKHGLETLHIGFSREEIHLPIDSEAFLLIQHIRDESHRFAITNHRKQRSKHKIMSRLEQIEGIGAVKRKALLNYFGGINEITSASIDEIAKVDGIGIKLAEIIYNSLH